MEAEIERMRAESAKQFSQGMRTQFDKVSSFKLQFPGVDFNTLMYENGHTRLRDGCHHYLDRKTGIIYFYNPHETEFNHVWYTDTNTEIRRLLFIEN